MTRASVWRASAGIALALVTAELAVRAHYTLVAAFEPEVGYVNAPGVVRWAREGHGVTQWTDHGVRAKTVDPLTPSVLFVGDSYTEALQVDQDEAFSEILRRTLTMWKLVPINIGRGSTSVAEHITLAPRDRRVFHPRWTVVTLNEDDLTDDAHTRDERRARFLRPESTAADLREGEPAPHTGLSFIWALRQRLMVVGYGYVRLGDLRASMLREPPLFRAGTKKAEGTPVSPQIGIENELEQLRDAWDDRLTILYLSEFDPAHPSGVTSEVERRVIAWCTRTGTSCVTPRGFWPELARRGLAPYGFSNTAFNEGHINALGHAACAEALRRELARLHENALF